MLIDWMQEVCDEFGLTRETFHLSVFYVDIFLSRQFCPLERLQLLGASSLMAACKVEEIVCPRVSHFRYATDNGFTNQEIIDIEAEIYRVLGFQLLPTTLSSWTNHFLSKWDEYSKANLANYKILKVSLKRPSLVLFKSDSIEDYNRFRSIMQAVDLSILDVNHYRYDARHIVSSCMYIQLGLTFDIFTRQQISTTPDVLTVITNAEQDFMKQEFFEMINEFI